jgi:ATP-dependent Clp protease adaptor protein ClpS
MTVTISKPIEGSQSGVAKPARVILYNDDWHTFDDVIAQLVKAGACDADEAEVHAWRVHTEGRSQVFHGPRKDCERVALVLREIRLQVEVDWDD